jgi:cytochrome c5
MRKGTTRKLTLNRESLRQLEQPGLAAAAAAAALGKTQFGTLCKSCHYGCPNYTLFGSCTC